MSKPINPFQFPENRPLTFRIGVTGAAIIVLVIVGWIDYLTGTELGFSIFYLLPIAGVTWYVNRRSGIMLSIFSAMVWLIANLMSNSESISYLIFYWNAVIRLGYFLIVAFLLARLRFAMEREYTLSHEDPLTRLSNIRVFYMQAEMELERSRRYGHPLTLAFMDCDQFKSINDRWGHLTGNQLLMELSLVLRTHVRANDLPARLGGDEFAILLPETNEEKARVVLSRLFSVLTETMVKHGWPVTFSIGVVTFETLPDSVEALVSAADNLMYQAKKLGKNQVLYRRFYSD